MTGTNTVGTANATYTFANEPCPCCGCTQRIYEKFCGYWFNTCAGCGQELGA